MRNKKKAIKIILLIAFTLLAGGAILFIATKINRPKEEPITPTAPKKSEAAPSGTILESDKIKVTVIDTGPGNYESNTYFKPGGQTDARPVTNNTLTQKYSIQNKTNKTMNIRLLVFPYKMYTIGATINQCTDLYSPAEINEFVKNEGNGNLEEAYKKFADIFYRAISSDWEVQNEPIRPNNETGTVQAGSLFLAESAAWQSVWTDNKNYKRMGNIISESGHIDWSRTGGWRQVNTSSYPGSGAIIAEAIFYYNQKVYEEIWRKNGNEYKGYRRVIEPTSSNPAYIPWEATNFEWKEVNINQYPGSGDFQSLTQYVTGNSESGLFITQSFWRGNKGYWRRIPVENGSPKWESDIRWSGPIEISSLPGEGDMQAQIASYMVGNWFYTSIMRGGKIYRRKAIVHNGNVFWNANHCYDNPAVPPHDPSGGQTRLNTTAGAGSLSCSYYREKNINTCTDSQTLISYGNNPPYFTSPEILTLEPGQTKEATFSITNNVCGFYQWDHGLLIDNSFVFWTGSEIKFFPCETSRDICTPLSFQLTQQATATPSPTATPTLTPSPSPSPTPSPTPTSRPLSSCNNSCVNNSDCIEGLSCYQNVCRNPQCSLETGCTCPTAAQTPQSTERTAQTTASPNRTPTNETITEEQSLPNAGNSTPKIIGIGISIILLLISIALAI